MQLYFTYKQIIYTYLQRFRANNWQLHNTDNLHNLYNPPYCYYYKPCSTIVMSLARNRQGLFATLNGFWNLPINLCTTANILKKHTKLKLRAFTFIAVLLTMSVKKGLVIPKPWYAILVTITKITDLFWMLLLSLTVNIEIDKKVAIKISRFCNVDALKNKINLVVFL